eukprot:scpid102186/ scgid16606/ 
MTEWLCTNVQDSLYCQTQTANATEKRHGMAGENRQKEARCEKTHINAAHQTVLLCPLEGNSLLGQVENGGNEHDHGDWADDLQSRGSGGGRSAVVAVSTDAASPAVGGGQTERGIRLAGEVLGSAVDAGNVTGGVALLVPRPDTNSYNLGIRRSG